MLTFFLRFDMRSPDTVPTLQSTSMTASPYRPCRLLPRKSGDVNRAVWTCRKEKKSRNGLAEFLSNNIEKALLNKALFACSWKLSKQIWNHTIICNINTRDILITALSRRYHLLKKKKKKGYNTNVIPCDVSLVDFCANDQTMHFMINNGKQNKNRLHTVSCENMKRYFSRFYNTSNLIKCLRVSILNSIFNREWAQCSLNCAHTKVWNSKTSLQWNCCTCEHFISVSTVTLILLAKV